jgi:VWFA-related protein
MVAEGTNVLLRTAGILAIGSVLVVGADALPAVRGAVQQPSGAPTFRSGVQLVEVAVLVHDRNGLFVRGLSPDDFQITEAGVRQSIAAFDFVSVPLQAAAPAGPQAPADVESNEHVGDSRIFVLLLDALHVTPRRSLAVRKYAREFIERHVGTGDLAAVVTPGGLEEATQDFTRDKAKLLAAVDAFVGVKLRSAIVERAEEAQAGINLRDGRDPSDTERAYRVRSLSAVLAALAGHLDRIERRRKTVLFFSEGVDYNLFDSLGVVQRSGTDVAQAMTRAVGALMRTNVSFYSIDPRGLSSAEGDQLETPIHRAPGNAAGQPDLTNPGAVGEYSASIRSLRYLAESTGGFAAVDRNDFGGAFDRIVRDSSSYYILGYTPSKPGRAGEFREIDVRVARPGLRVVARKGYVVPSPSREQDRPAQSTGSRSPWGPGPAHAQSPLGTSPVAAPRAPGVSADLAALLASPLPRAGLPIRLQAVSFRGDAKKGVVQIVVEALGQPLQFDERGGRFGERVELAMLTIDARGKASNGRSTTFDLRLRPEQIGPMRSTGVRWLARLTLAPGRHQVRVAGRATTTGLSGMVTTDVVVPPFHAGRATMSGVLITSLPSVLSITEGQTQLAAALGTPPSAARTFVAGDQIRAAVELYVPAFRSHTQPIARIERADGFRSPQLPPLALHGPARPGEAAFLIDTTKLTPGAYVLRIALTPDVNETIERTIPFGIVPRPGLHD